MDSNLLDNPHINVLVCIGIFGSFPISSRFDITIAALFDIGCFSLERTFFILSAERLMFLGTESSLIILSSTSVHCFIISLRFSDTVITTWYKYETKTVIKIIA
ncbi:Uncharacterised protein [uncultured archaeon]|nr:Uncharacterised protein [uncultured archaeon]